MRQTNRSVVLPSLAGLVAAAGLAAAASAAPIEVIYSKFAGHPTANIPGVLDLGGNPAVSDFRAFEQLIMSPDGKRWVLRARNQLGSDLETMLMIGSGTVGTMFAQEGQPVPGSPGELYDFFGSDTGRFNNLNEFAFSARSRGGPTATAQKVIYWDGTNFTLRFRQGDLISGLVDLAPNPSGDETVGNSVGSIHPLDDGTIGSQDSTVIGIHTSRRPVLMYNTTGFQQTGVTTITGLDGVGTQTWNTIDANQFATTPDGAHWMAEGRINNPGFAAPRVLVRNGTAVLQEGINVAGSGLLLGDIFATNLLSNGDWFSRGRDNSGTTAAAPDWAVRNGTLLAKTGDPIVTADSELWGDTFYAVTGNRRGDWILVGNTTNADAGLDNVVVFNGTRVVVREGDMVDLNGNGIADDDAFIGRGNNTLVAFQADSFVLTDNRVLYFLANIRNGAGQDLNSNPVFTTPLAFLRLSLAGCRADWDGSGSVNSGDVTAYLTAWFSDLSFGTIVSDFDDNNVVNSGDVTAYLGEWFFALANGCS